MSAIDPDFLAAYALAQQARDPEHLRILVKATGAALGAKVAEAKLAEVDQLVAYLRTMVEYTTGAMALKHLESVLAGGSAPRSASAPKP